MDRIVCLCSASNLYGVYRSGGARGPYGTPLMFKGRLDSCIQWRKAHS